MSRRTPAPTGILLRQDPFGRDTIPGVREWLTERRLRQITRARNHFIHRSPNGHRDPFSFWHLLDVLMAISPDYEWNSKQLADLLNTEKPRFSWDPVTVGRILGDIIESCEMANGQGLDVAPIIVRRNSAGKWYQMTNQPAGRRVLQNLLEDLAKLCDKLMETEMAGALPARTESPLLECPSVMT